MHRMCAGVLSFVVAGALPCAASAQDCAWTVQQLTSSEYYTAHQTISGDGQRIAFVRFENNGLSPVFVLDVATGATEQIGYGSYPAFSSDGSRLAFIDGNNGFTVFNLATREAASWPVGPFDVEYGFSGDGSRIAFVSDRNDLVPGDRNPMYFRQVFVLEVSSGAV